MQTLSVLLQKDKPVSVEQFRKIVDKVRQQVSTAPVTIELRENWTDSYHIFTFISWSAEEYTLETRDIVRSFVSLAVMEWIIEYVQPYAIRQLLVKEFPPEMLKDWETLYPYILNVLNEMDSMQTEVSYKTKLYQQILEYLQEHRELVLDGFIRFRLKRYMDMLSDAIELGHEQFREDKEYKEFIELLRYFVSLQETRYELVHVLKGTSKPFYFFDENGHLINLDQLDMVLQSVGQEFREEDYVVSALITLSPKRILFHLSEQKSALEDTLRHIFGDRLSACKTCAYCLNVKRVLDFIKPSHYNS